MIRNTKMKPETLKLSDFIAALNDTFEFSKSQHS